MQAETARDAAREDQFHVQRQKEIDQDVDLKGKGDKGIRMQ